MTDEEHEIAVAIAAEIRAHDLLAALRDAVAGAPLWRPNARELLLQIDEAVPPPLHEPHPHDEAA